MFMQAEGDLSFPDGKITGLEFYAGLFCADNYVSLSLSLSFLFEG